MTESEQVEYMIGYLDWNMNLFVYLETMFEMKNVLDIFKRRCQIRLYIPLWLIKVNNRALSVQGG